MSDFKTAVEAIIGKPPDGFEWQPLLHYTVSGKMACTFESVPLWVPPKGVFKPGWITRDRGSLVFEWNKTEGIYNAEHGFWIYEFESYMLAVIHPDSLPPLTIPAHLCKFRVGDE